MYAYFFYAPMFSFRATLNYLIFNQIHPNYSGRCRLPEQRRHWAQTAMLFKEGPNQYKFPPMPPACLLHLKYSHKLTATGQLFLNSREPEKDKNTCKMRNSINSLEDFFFCTSLNWCSLVLIPYANTQSVTKTADSREVQSWGRAICGLQHRTAWALQCKDLPMTHFSLFSPRLISVQFSQSEPVRPNIIPSRFLCISGNCLWFQHTTIHKYCQHSLPFCTAYEWGK